MKPARADIGAPVVPASTIRSEADSDQQVTAIETGYGAGRKHRSNPGMAFDAHTYLPVFMPPEAP